MLDDVWSKQKYRKAPYVMPEEGDLVHSLSSGAMGVEGWAVAYVVPVADYPRIVELRRELDALANERRAALQEYVDSLP